MRRAAGDSPALLGRRRQPVVPPRRSTWRRLRGGCARALRQREHRAVDWRTRLHARGRGGANNRADRPAARTRCISSATPTAAASRSTWRWPGRTESPAWRSTSLPRFICCDRWVSRAPTAYARDRRALRGVCAEGVVTGDYRGAVAAFVDYWNGYGAWETMRPAVQSALIRWAPKATARLPRPDRRADAG